MNDDKETIRLLKAELHDAQQSSISNMEDLTFANVMALMVEEALLRAGTIMGAARMLEIHHITLKTYMRKLGIARPHDNGRPRKTAA